MREPPIEALLGSNGVSHFFLSKCAFSYREERPRKLCGSLSHELLKEFTGLIKTATPQLPTKPSRAEAAKGFEPVHCRLA